MNCEMIRKKELAERYREGRLEPDLVEAYEQHYFECDRCFADLRLRDQLDADLRAHGRDLFAAEIAAESRVGRRDARRSDSRPGLFGWLQPGWATGLVATTAIVALALLTTVLRTQDAASELRGLWEPVAHPYVPAELRDMPGGGEFRRAMASYQAGNYEAAAKGLASARDSAPNDPDIRFYLGVSHLMIDRARPAIAELEQAIARAPSSDVYRWYLAQAHLKAGEREPAEAELRRVAESGGEFSPRAQALLAKLAAIE